MESNNSSASNSFHQLLDICDHLMGPSGCPWDREQTLVSMRESILEEACEVIEAIDEGNDVDLIEELGDLLYNIIFFCKLAEKEKRFVTNDPILAIYEKLIARHPHVFGEEQALNAEEVIEKWEAIKKAEKKERESLMDGIPKGLPSLARAYKIAKKMHKIGFASKIDNLSFESEDELGELLWQITKFAEKKKMNPETALRKTIVEKEQVFRKWEKERK